jgi:hypothetical protein
MMDIDHLMDNDDDVVTYELVVDELYYVLGWITIHVKPQHWEHDYIRRHHLHMAAHPHGNTMIYYPPYMHHKQMMVNKWTESGVESGSYLC